MFEIVDLTGEYGDIAYPLRSEDIITDLIVHHTQGREPTSLNDAIKIVEEVHQYHLTKWPGFAYHRMAWRQYYFLIRPRRRNGWHTGGMDIEPRNGIGDANDKGMAVVIPGDFTHDEPDQLTLHTIARGKQWEEQQLGRELMLSGHQDHAATACPSEGWQFWRKKIVLLSEPVPVVTTSTFEDLVNALGYLTGDVANILETKTCAPDIVGEMRKVGKQFGVRVRL